MKKSILLLILLLFVLGWYGYVAKKDYQVESIKAERSFAVSKDKVQKVIITQKNGVVNTIVNRSGIWYVNGDRMNSNQVNLLLEAISRVRMLSIPPKGAIPAIMKGFAKNGVFIQVFDSNKLLKAYAVGGVPQDERGSYYLMRGSSQPYLVGIPGMEGSLKGRFVKQYFHWLDRAMFRYPNKDVSRISVAYPRAKNRSFELKIKGRDYEVNPLDQFTSPTQKRLNQRLVEDYLSSFYEGFFTESYENDHPLRDSIVENMNPFCVLEVEDTKGNINTLDFYPRLEVFDSFSKQRSDQEQALGPEVGKFIERYYVNVNSGEKFMLTQHILAKKFLWGYDYFFR